MKITSVSVVKNKNEDSRMKGIATILIDDQFAVHDIRIIGGDNGLFTAMPSRKMATGGYRDVAHLITLETMNMIEKNNFRYV